MNCLTYQKLINLDIDHCLPLSHADELIQHMHSCRECQDYYQQLRCIDQLLAAEIVLVDPPADLAASIVAALPGSQAVVPVRRKQRKRRRIAWAAGAAATFALLAGSAFGLLNNGDKLPALEQGQVVAEQQPGRAPFHFWAGNKQQPSDNQQTTSDDNPGVTQTLPPDGEETSPDPTTPSESGEEITYITQVNLPAVASNFHAEGSFAAITLAAYQECDAVLPRMEADSLVYYTEVEGVIIKWQASMDGSGEPQAQGEVDALPAAEGWGIYAEDEQGSYYYSLSPNGKTTAQNRADGLYLLSNDQEQRVADAGGLLLAWSPDGNKLLFSNSDGQLFLYYPVEGHVLDTLFAASSACWSDANHIVLAAGDNATGRSSIFRITTP